MTTNFFILNQPASGRPDEVQPINITAPEYAYIASTANIAIHMIDHPTTRQHLTDLALLWDSKQIQRSIFSNNPNTARAAVDMFLSKIQRVFPMIVVNDTITDLNLTGYHPRGDWEGQPADFDPRKQAVHMNAQRVRDMVQSVNAGDNFKRFQYFQFMFAVMFVHEVGAHMLITFLSNGRRPLTPPGVEAPGYGNEDEGESGRRLEWTLFGGTFSFYRDPSRMNDNRQPGIPYLDLGNNRTQMIHPNAITRTTQFVFSFPLERAGPVVDSRTMRPMGLLPGVPSSNPNERRMLQAMPRIRAPARSGFNVRTKDLRVVPSNPRVRLKAY